MTKLPTFLFIGADRCGSKWLHNIFLHHPDVFVPEIADPYFFDRQYHRGLEWYANLFKDAPGGAKAIGELSHDYLHSVETARRIHEHLPDVKIIATLRHPAERSFSSYQAACDAGVIRGSFEDALNEHHHLVHNSRYHQNLTPFFELFDRSNIKIMLYDQLMSDPRGYAREIFDFIGVPFVDGLDYDVIFNPLSSSRASVGGAIAKHVARGLRKVGLVEVLGWAKRRSGVRAIFYKDYSAEQRPTVSPATRRRLVEKFGDEINSLEMLIRRDLAAWRV